MTDQTTVQYLFVFPLLYIFVLSDRRPVFQNAVRVYTQGGASAMAAASKM